MLHDGSLTLDRWVQGKVRIYRRVCRKLEYNFDTGIILLTKNEGWVTGVGRHVDRRLLLGH